MLGLPWIPEAPNTRQRTSTSPEKARAQEAQLGVPLLSLQDCFWRLTLMSHVAETLAGVCVAFCIRLGWASGIVPYPYGYRSI